MRKRFLAMVLSLAMVAALATAAASPAHAATNNEALAAAEELHRLGLFQGVGNNADGSINYDLNRAMSREEGVTMLVRLLGMEDEAKKGTWKAPFTDVSEWAKPYVNYAYTNELTNGIGNNQYGGGTGYTMTAAQYLTFCLRSMGYTSGKDFQWDKAWELSDKLGITNKQYNSGNNTKFTRGDAAIVSLATYRATMLRIYGLPADMRLVENPDNPEAYIMNFVYNMAIGHYDDWIPGDMRETGFLFGINAWELRAVFPELFGGLAFRWNGLGLARYEDSYRFFLEKSSLKSVWDQNNEAIKAARKIQSELHSSGAIHDGMTQQEIANTYFKYMREKYVPDIEYVKEAEEIGATAYACLVEKKCNSVGRAAAFNILMHLEGITSICVPMVDRSHANLMFLDGEVRIADFGDKDGSLWSSNYDELVDYQFQTGKDVGKPWIELMESVQKGYFSFCDCAWKHVHMFLNLFAPNGIFVENLDSLKDNDHFTLKTVEGNLKVEYIGDCIFKYTPTDGSKITISDPQKFRIGDARHPEGHPLQETVYIKDGSLYDLEGGVWVSDILHDKGAPSTFKGGMKKNHDIIITNGTTTWTAVTEGVE